MALLFAGTIYYYWADLVFDLLYLAIGNCGIEVVVVLLMIIYSYYLLFTITSIYLIIIGNLLLLLVVQLVFIVWEGIVVGNWYLFISDYWYLLCGIGEVFI